MQLVRTKEKKTKKQTLAQEFAKILVGKWKYENSVKAKVEIKRLQSKNLL